MVRTALENIGAGSAEDTAARTEINNRQILFIPLCKSDLDKNMNLFWTEEQAADFRERVERLKEKGYEFYVERNGPHLVQPGEPNAFDMLNWPLYGDKPMSSDLSDELRLAKAEVVGSVETLGQVLESVAAALDADPSTVSEVGDDAGVKAQLGQLLEQSVRHSESLVERARVKLHQLNGSDEHDKDQYGNWIFGDPQHHLQHSPRSKGIRLARIDAAKADLQTANFRLERDKKKLDLFGQL